MELYQKPVMEIVDLEKVDVLTCSKSECSLHPYHIDCLKDLSRCTGFDVDGGGEEE